MTQKLRVYLAYSLQFTMKGSECRNSTRQEPGSRTGARLAGSAAYRLVPPGLLGLLALFVLFGFAFPKQGFS